MGVQVIGDSSAQADDDKDLGFTQSEVMEWTRVLERQTLDDVPREWKTREQLSELWCLSKTHTLRVLRECIKSGDIEMKTYRVRVGGDGQVRPIQHYKVIESSD